MGLLSFLLLREKLDPHFNTTSTQTLHDTHQTTMQALQILLALTPAFTTILAQSAAEAALPQCVSAAFFAAIPPSGCQVSDVQCICSTPELLDAIHSAVQSACSPSDQAAAAAFASSYCATSSASLSASASDLATATETVDASTETDESSTMTDLPSSIDAPDSTSVLSGTLVVDTTAFATVSTTSIPASHSATTTTTVKSTASATSSAKPTDSSAESSGMNFGAGLAVLAVVGGVMSVAFAEL
ncbi:hypothetical protein LTR56_023855 [Elasticomyces elasticus]|nr:hypothetical protein LTR56_023855 [Elasticomyces elasticus]KAK3666853.1 hypothetical protein LTR22_002440 [Elasticomyces elasticus]KAK4907776.1 hypothetical protein LTR49_023240 [Elasticomyces elasticus]KAK5746987.1 hypothetical protein LTS12_022556 [Elasticomyces elasticus]